MASPSESVPQPGGLATAPRALTMAGEWGAGSTKLLAMEIFALCEAAERAREESRGAAWGTLYALAALGLGSALLLPLSRLELLGLVPVAAVLAAASWRADWIVHRYPSRVQRARRALAKPGKVAVLLDEGFQSALQERVGALIPPARPFLAGAAAAAGPGLPAMLFGPLIYRGRHPEQLTWFDCLLPAFQLWRGSATQWLRLLVPLRADRAIVAGWALLAGFGLAARLWSNPALWGLTLAAAPFIAVYALLQLLIGTARVESFAAQQAMLEELARDPVGD